MGLSFNTEIEITLENRSMTNRSSNDYADLAVISADRQQYCYKPLTAFKFINRNSSNTLTLKIYESH